MVSGIWYATREQVTQSLEVFNSARANPIIDAKIAAATVSIDKRMHRSFYPEIRTIKADWPNYSSSPSWEFDLWGNEIISLVSLVSGGVTIPNVNAILRRADDKVEPPYTSLELSLASSSAFSGGSTFQQSLLITGLFGWNDTDTSIVSAALGANINSSVTTLILNPVAGVYDVGVGSILLIGTERLIVTARRMSDTTANTAGTLASQQNAVSLTVTDGTLFAVGETILVESERMRINDIAGNVLTVSRAWDGTVLASHASGLDVYALRTFTAKRGQLGTTAAAHITTDGVYTHAFPPLINELCIAEAVTLLEQNAGGYARVIGTGSAARETKGEGLADVRDQAEIAYRRRGRLGAI